MQKIIWAHKEIHAPFSGGQYFKKLWIWENLLAKLEEKNAALITALTLSIFWNKNNSCHGTFKIIFHAPSLVKSDAPSISSTSSYAHNIHFCPVSSQPLWPLPGCCPPPCPMSHLCYSKVEMELMLSCNHLLMYSYIHAVFYHVPCDTCATARWRRSSCCLVII